MIKNRESACQSRQRRKEYVHTLENRLTDCLEENQNLRTSNQQLRDKVQELENENSRLRKLAILTTSGQRRAACILMLVLFVGFNVHPLTFLADRSISGEDRPIKFDESGNFNTPQNWPVPVKSGFHARQLLSVEEQGAERAGVGGVGEGSRVSSNLKKDSFWMDDLVNNYKKEHMDKILGVLRDTSSISLQRMLRRKLKEELGIRVPMPIPRTRRIAYTPQLSQERKALGNSPVEKLKFDVPSPPPNVKPPTKDHACGQSSHVD
uniref:BZIP domain-containing protein n=1 Tax=Ciona savignyi TaxID=51511 RepID=H2YS81_CIOSA